MTDGFRGKVCVVTTVVINNLERFSKEKKKKNGTNNNFHSIIEIELNGTLGSPLVGYRHRNTPTNQFSFPFVRAAASN